MASPTVISKEFDFQDLKNEQMKEVAFENDDKFMVIKHNDSIYALSNKCTHYGGPLINGVLHNGKIRCPWHGACFNIKNGDIEEFPGLDGLQCYNVENICGTKYRITKLNSRERIDKPLTDGTIIIIGSGPCGLECAETLRKEGYSGKIIMFSKEKFLPYDRPKLSKAIDSKIDAIKLRTNEFFEKNNIELHLDLDVDKIDFEKNCIYIRDTQAIKYDKLMLAVGTVPNLSQSIGSSLKNIFVLRRYEDAQNISSQIGIDKKVVILGSSFIAMEAASFLMGKVASVTIISRTAVPFENILGKELGIFIKNMHIQNGVYFIPNVSITEFGGKDGAVSYVSLTDGQIIPCDMCILGLGVKPLNELFINSEALKLNPRGFIITDEYMRTNVANVYAGGDIVAFPLTYKDANPTVNIQHWQMALKHGQVAALNMLDKKIPLESVPYFWSVHYGKSIRYVGNVNKYDSIITHGSTEKGKFVLFYIEDKIVAAVLTYMRDPVSSIFAEIFLKKIKVNEIQLQLLAPTFEEDRYIESLKNLLASSSKMTHF